MGKIAVEGVMQKWDDLSDVQSGMMVGFRANGGNISEMANFEKCSRATVVKVHRAWQNSTLENQKRGKCDALRAVDDRYDDDIDYVDDDGCGDMLWRIDVQSLCN